MLTSDEEGEFRFEANDRFRFGELDGDALLLPAAVLVFSAFEPLTAEAIAGLFASTSFSQRCSNGFSLHIFLKLKFSASNLFPVFNAFGSKFGSKVLVQSFSSKF